jgi:hypothetical protein
MYLTACLFSGMLEVMEWSVAYHEEYVAELRAEPEAVQVAVFAASGMLQHFGPQLNRPHGPFRIRQTA